LAFFNPGVQPGPRALWKSGQPQTRRSFSARATNNSFRGTKAALGPRENSPPLGQARSYWIALWLGRGSTFSNSRGAVPFLDTAGFGPAPRTAGESILSGGTQNPVNSGDFRPSLCRPGLLGAQQNFPWGFPPGSIFCANTRSEFYSPGEKAISAWEMRQQLLGPGDTISGEEFPPSPKKGFWATPTEFFLGSGYPYIHRQLARKHNPGEASANFHKPLLSCPPHEAPNPVFYPRVT